MIILKLRDGLGNQMFQYAMGRYLQSEYKEPVFFETTKLMGESIRKLGITNCNINCVDRNPGTDESMFATGLKNYSFMIYSKVIRTYYERLRKIRFTGQDAYNYMIDRGVYTSRDSITYYPFKRTNKKYKFVRGYFQSEKYFYPIRKTIKKELQIIKSLSGSAIEYADMLGKSNSVGVQIRRGDYIGHKLFDLCDYEYYENAIKRMEKLNPGCKFFVFSNSKADLEWISQNYKFSLPVSYVDVGENEYDDLYMLYHCRNHIISNSTFGWWGSYLCSNEKNITISPSKWMNNYSMKQDILLDGWIKM